MAAVTLQPAAGAHGELTGILMIRAYHRSRGDHERTEVLVPDSSHGTNPATATMAGFRTITIPSAPDGGVDLDAFRAALGPQTAAIMITNPSTLGPVRAPDRRAARRDARGRRARLHGRRQPQRDPRPLQAGRGRLRRHAHQHPQDVQHAARRRRTGRRAGRGPRRPRSRSCPRRASCAPTTARTASRPPASGRRPSAGCARSSAARASSCARTPTCARTASDGLAEVSDDAVLAANYLKARLGEAYDIPFDRACKHEFVASAAGIKHRTGVRTLDVAKRLIDKGYHPPTIYFPLTVEEAHADRADGDRVARDARRLRRRADRDRARGRDGSRSSSRPRRTAPRSVASTRRPPPASRTSAGVA